MEVLQRPNVRISVPRPQIQKCSFAEAHALSQRIAMLDTDRYRIAVTYDLNSTDGSDTSATFGMFKIVCEARRNAGGDVLELNCGDLQYQFVTRGERGLAEYVIDQLNTHPVQDQVLTASAESSPAAEPEVGWNALG